MRAYQGMHPEISYEKMLEKRDELVKVFDAEAAVFTNKVFASDFDYTLYLSSVEKVEAFLEQHLVDGKYQCNSIIASSLNWERTYLELTSALESVTQGMKKAMLRVEDWNAAQVKAIDSTMLLLFKEYYTKNLAAKKNAFGVYVMQLISEAYYATNSSTDNPSGTSSEPEIT